jgi:Aspartyl/Asparaginyl beta-hydroxylase
MSIQQLLFNADIDQMNKDLVDILKVTDWGDENQIGLTHRPNAKDLYKDAVGSLYRDQKVMIANEQEFTEINEQLPFYTNMILHNFAKFQRIKLGRVRLMRLLPKRGLSFHRDATERYHLVLKTNIDSFLGFRAFKEDMVAGCYHIPRDGYFYRVDTTKMHFAYNAGAEERIHMVVVPRR